MSECATPTCPCHQGGACWGLPRPPREKLRRSLTPAQKRAAREAAEAWAAERARVKAQRDAERRRRDRLPRRKAAREAARIGVPTLADRTGIDAVELERFLAGGPSSRELRRALRYYDFRPNTHLRPFLQFAFGRGQRGSADPADWQSRVDLFVKHRSRAPVLDVVDDIDRLVAALPPRDDVARMLWTMGCRFAPHAVRLSARAWLAAVRDRLAAQVARADAAREPTPHTAAVQAFVEEAVREEGLDAVAERLRIPPDELRAALDDPRPSRDARARMNELVHLRFDTLRNFVSCYFHEDAEVGLSDLGPAWDAQVTADASCQSADYLQSLAREADELMAAVPDDEALDGLLRWTFGAHLRDDDPDSRTREILCALRDRVRALPGRPPGDWWPRADD